MVTWWMYSRWRFDQTVIFVLYINIDPFSHDCHTERSNLFNANARSSLFETSNEIDLNHANAILVSNVSLSIL
jgi:hypothetical protein